MRWRHLPLLAISLGLAAIFTPGACAEDSQEQGDFLALQPSPHHLRGAESMSNAISALLEAGPEAEDSLFALAPQFGAALSAYCASKPCERLALEPLFPAGRGLMARPRLVSPQAHHEFPPLFLRQRAEHWELLDALPPEIEGGPRQLAVRGTVALLPHASMASGNFMIEAGVTIEVLSADQRYLLFDFFDAAEVAVEDLMIEDRGKPLRFTRQGPLLIVELREGTRSAELQFSYTATLGATASSATEFVLYENYLPYLGGAASWSLNLQVPKGFELGIPAEPVREGKDGSKVYLLSGDELDRYPIVGSSLAYATERFEHQGTRFEVWLRPAHAGRLSAVVSAVRKSMDAFECLGAFPSSQYRILEASYAEGHGALGLRNMMVLGEELLDDKHLLPAVAHELSHAWFAGLLRDPQGRWSEGLASYLSQWPLAKARARLMRWGWTVAYEQVPAHRDHALKGDAPASREDEELAGAIFYGKAALVFQELETRIGMQKMRQVLSLFVIQYRGGSVRWRELQQSVADVMGNAEARRLGLWLDEARAPEWEFADLRVSKGKLRGALLQRSQFPFTGTVVVGTMSEQSELLSELPVEVSAARSEFSISLPPQARWLIVDPGYTMPRRASLDGKPRWMVRIGNER